MRFQSRKSARYLRFARDLGRNFSSNAGKMFSGESRRSGGFFDTGGCITRKRQF
jgi:hypothetical protein